MNIKKRLFMLQSAVLLCSAGTFAQGEYSATVGDVNGDSVVDVADIASVISVMAGNTNDSLADYADINGDGTVDVADIATVISIMAGNDIVRTGIQLWLADGSTQFLPLDEAPMAKFNGDMLIVTGKTQEISTCLSSGAVKVVFANENSTSQK